MERLLSQYFTLVNNILYWTCHVACHSVLKDFIPNPISGLCFSKKKKKKQNKVEEKTVNASLFNKKLYILEKLKQLSDSYGIEFGIIPQINTLYGHW